LTQQPINRRSFIATCAVAGALAAPAFGQAQDYPSKPIKLIVAYPAGGSADAVARQLAAGLGKRLGQTVVVENKAGGNTIIATQFVATAPADGYTLYFTYTTPYTMNPAMYKKLPYNPETDFTPVAFISDMDTGIVVHADSPFKTVRDLVDYAKANPGKLSHGSPGTTQVLALSTAIFKNNTGIDVTHIPYQGSAPAVQALLSKQIDLLLTDIGSAGAHIRAGTLRPLAVVGNKRLAALPDTPTLAEAGFRDVAIPLIWSGIVAPPRLPKPIVTRLNEAISAEVKSPEMTRLLETFSLKPMSGTPEQLAAAVRSDVDAWGQVIRQLKIQLD